MFIPDEEVNKFYYNVQRIGKSYQKKQKQTYLHFFKIIQIKVMYFIFFKRSIYI